MNFELYLLISGFKRFFLLELGGCKEISELLKDSYKIMLDKVK